MTHLLELEIEYVHLNANVIWSCEKQTYMQTIIQSDMIIYMVVVVVV